MRMRRVTRRRRVGTCFVPFASLARAARSALGPRRDALVRAAPLRRELRLQEFRDRDVFADRPRARGVRHLQPPAAEGGRRADANVLFFFFFVFFVLFLILVAAETVGFRRSGKAVHHAAPQVTPHAAHEREPRARARVRARRGGAVQPERVARRLRREKTRVLFFFFFFFFFAPPFSASRNVFVVVKGCFSRVVRRASRRAYERVVRGARRDDAPKQRLGAAWNVVQRVRKPRPEQFRRFDGRFLFFSRGGRVARRGGKRRRVPRTVRRPRGFRLETRPRSAVDARGVRPGRHEDDPVAGLEKPGVGVVDFVPVPGGDRLEVRVHARAVRLRTHALRVELHAEVRARDVLERHHRTPRTLARDVLRGDPFVDEQTVRVVRVACFFFVCLVAAAAGDLDSARLGPRRRAKNTRAVALQRRAVDDEAVVPRLFKNPRYVFE